jgi:DNA-binding NarL/FixJ family response regulator
MTPPRINIVFAEDHKLVRQTLIPSLKESNVYTIAEAEDGFQLLEILKTKQPDVILLDIEMPKMNGCEAFRKIKKLYPKQKVVFLSTHGEDMLVELMYDEGAEAYLTKNSDVQLVIETIQAVHADKYIQKRTTRTSDTDFSERESQVSALICDGLSNKAIADNLNITEKTVEAHKKKLFIKTKTQSAAAFVSYIFKKGLNYLR